MTRHDQDDQIIQHCSHHNHTQVEHSFWNLHIRGFHRRYMRMFRNFLPRVQLVLVTSGHS